MSGNNAEQVDSRELESIDFGEGDNAGMMDSDARTPDPQRPTHDRDGTQVRDRSGRDLATRTAGFGVDEKQLDFRDPGDETDVDDSPERDAKDNKNDDDYRDGDREWLSDDLMRDASLEGITPSEARRLGSAEAVREAIAIARRSGAGSKSRQDAPPPEDDDELKLSDEELEDMPAPLRKIIEHQNKVNKKLREQLSAATGALNDVGLERQITRFDSLLSRADNDSFQDLFGKGESLELDDRTKEYERRSALFDRWQEDLNRARSAGKRITARVEREMFDQAVNALFHKDIQKVQRERAARRNANRRQFVTARPSSGSSSRSDGGGINRDRALEFIQSHFRQ